MANSAAVESAVAQPIPQVAAGPMIPLRLLAVPGTALVVLLAAIFSDRLWPLDFLHVTFGGLWTGVDLFMGFVVGPVLRRLDPPVRERLSARWYG